ncbi:MAG: hypothetical protein JNL90_12630 [Planctomycetes bacterium]|nr:hypothetical protein [Planctomycetota bacterium]
MPQKKLIWCLATALAFAVCSCGGEASQRGSGRASDVRLGDRSTVQRGDRYETRFGPYFWTDGYQFVTRTELATAPIIFFLAGFVIASVLAVMFVMSTALTPVLFGGALASSLAGNWVSSTPLLWLVAIAGAACTLAIRRYWISLGEEKYEPQRAPKRFFLRLPLAVIVSWTAVFLLLQRMVRRDGATHTEVFEYFGLSIPLFVGGTLFWLIALADSPRPWRDAAAEEEARKTRYVEE